MEVFGLGWWTERLGKGAGIGLGAGAGAAALGVSGSGAREETAGKGEVAGMLVAVVMAEAAFACAGELGQGRNGAAVAVAGAR